MIKRIIMELFQFSLFFAFIVGISTDDLSVSIIYGIGFVVATITKELNLPYHGKVKE